MFCNPWGQEYLRAHQSLRFLAGLTAEKDLHALRFDYFGTGDSGGTSFEGDDPRDWVQDLNEAIGELKDTAALRSVALVGLRLGAAIAAEVALRRKDVDRLVLWDPVLDGPAYAEELVTLGKAITGSAGKMPAGFPSEGGVVQTMGFPMTQPGQAGIRSILPSLIQAGLPPVLLISTVPDPERYSFLERALDEAGIEWSRETVEGPEAWVEEENFGTSGMPVAALRRMSEWLA